MSFAPTRAMSYSLERRAQVLFDMDYEEAYELLDRLTPAQTDVLDRVLLHKTSKEIARELGIAPNTVDQRIKAAWAKLGTGDRAATARKYALIKSVCGQSTYGSSGVDTSLLEDHELFRDIPAEATFVIEDSMQRFHEVAEPKPAILEALDDRFGRLGRVAAILACAVFMATLVLTVTTIAVTLSNLI